MTPLEKYLEREVEIAKKEIEKVINSFARVTFERSVTLNDIDNLNIIDGNLIVHQYPNGDLNYANEQSRSKSEDHKKKC